MAYKRGGAAVLTSPADAIEGLGMFGYGNSYMGVALPICGRNWFNRVSGRIHSAFAIGKGVNGWLAPDVCNYAHGTFTAATNGGLGTVAGTWTPGGVASNSGVVFLDLVRNDAGWDGLSSTKARAGFVNALDGLLRLLRAGSALQDTNAAFVYTGTWTNAALPSASGGNGHHTTTPGDKVTITTPVGTDFDLIILGFDQLISGAAFTVKVDGVDITATLAAAGFPTTTGTQLNETKVLAGSPWVNMAIPLRGLSSAAHTVVVTHAGTSGQWLEICRLLTPSLNPPTVVVHKCAPVGTAGYSQYTAASASAATDAVYNGLIDTVVARFVVDGSIKKMNPVDHGWNPATCISSQDGQSLHYNDVGAAAYADGDMAILNALPFRLGMSIV